MFYIHSTCHFSADITSPEVLIPQTTDKLCPARGMLTASGTSSPLGDSEVLATDCVTMLEGGSTLQFNQGRMVLAANDGNRAVIANYQGFFHLVPARSTGNTRYYLMSDGAFTIIGSTGRYMKATGGGTLSGVESVDANPALLAHGQLQAKGNISY